MPAEWERHQATWLSWPHNLETWPEELDDVEAAFAQIVRALVPHETVHINVNDPAHERHVRGLLKEYGVEGNVVFHHIPTNDAWIRDHGAIFVKRDTASGSELIATNWEFNSWGEKYPPWDLDNEVPAKMASALEVREADGGIVLEGGSIEVNGKGTLLTTERCLLNPNRNPHLSKSEIEQILCDAFGVDQVVWLSDGIAGDDTDGHIDDLTRFVSPDTLVTVVEDDPSDVNYEVLQENLKQLNTFATLEGRPFDIVTLPMPDPVYIRGERMPASYANFYIANGTVLLPSYRDPMDDVAAETLGRLFPDRRIVKIDCSVLIWGLGAIHCLTQQVPAAD